MEYVVEWKYFTSLTFLTDQFTHRDSKGNFSKNEEEDILNKICSTLQGECDDATECMEEFQDVIDSTPHSITPSSINLDDSYSRKNPKKRCSNEDMGQALLEVEKRKLMLMEQKREKIEDDEDLNFFKSLLPHVKSLSSCEKLEYRMQVLKLTQEVIKK